LFYRYVTNNKWTLEKEHYETGGENRSYPPETVKK
jgi:hypothetical protein